MNRRHGQEGMTLVVALVMLVVLTLLVVSAIRFGNINLRISGNAQSEAEASAAAQVAVETMVKTIDASSNISSISSQTINVSTGGATYTVSITKPVCLYNKNIDTGQLDPSNAADLPCFESADAERQVTADNTLTTTPTACKNQQWDVQASVDDTSRGGAKTSMLQGITARVGAEVVCP